MKYQEIKTDNTKVPHKTIRGLVLAIQHKKLKDGVYKATCPNGNVHTWELSSTFYTCKGSTGRKNKKLVGKGTLKVNTKAKFKK